MFLQVHFIFFSASQNIALKLSTSPGSKTFGAGKEDGKFFYTGLVEETSTYRLAYYTNMAIGTKVKNDNILHYTG